MRKQRRSSFELPEAVDWALRIPGLRPKEQLILVLLCKHFNYRDGFSFPSVPTIATEAHVSHRHVQRIIRRLAARGVLAKVEANRRENGSYTSNRYFPAVGTNPEQWAGPVETTVSREKVKAFHALLSKRFTDAKMLQQYMTWLKPVDVIAIEKKRLLVVVPNEHFEDKIKTTYSEILLKAAREVFSPSLQRFTLKIRETSN